MSLTTDDLRAIKTIVNDAVEDSKLQTAAGFEEVHNKLNAMNARFSTIDDKFITIDDRFDAIDSELNSVKQTVERIERIQSAEVSRLDQHEQALKKLRTDL